ncbi:MAG: AMP-binding protein, partial [Acidobacteria bacterium]|nr:AMP-binding protein [Acidobacteriota bacterium]
MIAGLSIYEALSGDRLSQADFFDFALHFEGRDTTYAAFDRHTSQVANALITAGVKHGERICYLGKNSDHYFELFFGAIKMGAVMTPLNWRLAPPEIAYIVNDSAAPILFVGPE